MAIKQKSPKGSSGLNWLKPLALVLLVAVTLVATVYIMFLQPVNSPPGQKVAPAPGKSSTPPSPIPPPPPEPTLPPPEADLEPIESKTPPDRGPASPSSGKPLVAIIIDDLGQQKKIPEQLLALELNFTFAFLPQTPFAQELARQAQAAHRDILLHLPMEPEDSHWNPGPGTLLVNMNPETIRQTLLKDLAGAPLAIGINNHMGSRFSADRQAMTIFLSTVRERHLFFVDSLTSGKSVGWQLAQEMGIKSARRDIFLDNEQDPDKIAQQIQALIALAVKNGSAIGIGHPHPATLAALTRMAGQLRAQVTLVGVQSLVK